MCTVTKSVHTKKVWKLIECTRTNKLVKILSIVLIASVFVYCTIAIRAYSKIIYICFVSLLEQNLVHFLWVLRYILILKIWQP